MVESLFAFLFKYRPLLFEQGQVGIDERPPLLVAVIVAGTAALTVLSYRTAKADVRWRDRTILMALRVGVLAVILLCLFRPVLILKTAVPQENFVGVLIDDSRSMRIADRNNEPRNAVVERNFGAPDSPLVAALSKRFALRFFRFSAFAERLARVGDLAFDGTQTRVSEALEGVRDELGGLPLAGIVLVTDGADTSDTPVAESLLTMKAASVPVFTVGVGRETLAPDIQVSRVEAPRSVLKGSSLLVDVTIAQSGYEGATVPLLVESDGRILSSQDVILPENGESAVTRVQFTADEPGPRVFRFRVPPQPGELVTQNNAQDLLIQVEDRREKILYFEGEPRFEMKFIRQAVADDKNLHVVVLQRTAKDKYLRLDVDSPDELVTGFPTSREELFAYRGLIVGSVEAGAFTADQLRMIDDFAGKRGGGLLMLGGRHSFAEGGYEGTPIADVLPILLESGGGRGSQSVFRLLNVRPTREGASQPATRLASTEEESNARWKNLPPVSSVNEIHRIKPGATVLLNGADKNGQQQVVLAYQLYGRGKSLVLPVQDTWMWRMDARMAVTDTTYETFWRRLLRWLVDGVPDKVMVTASPEPVEPGQRVALRADVVDATYDEVNDSRVVAHVTTPSGKSIEIPMDWDVKRNGEYLAGFAPGEQGLYEIRVEASRGGATLGTAVTHVRTMPGNREYFDAAMRAALLRRVAQETGGQFYTPETMASLPEDISHSGHGITTVERLDLWDMPALLFVLIGLALGEWAFRRAKGLA